jgi:hypothetical protein
MRKTPPASRLDASVPMQRRRALPSLPRGAATISSMTRIVGEVSARLLADHGTIKQCYGVKTLSNR